MDDLAGWVELDGCFNFRDLGGYHTDDGRRVRPGQVFRSDGLHHLTARDLEHLRGQVQLGSVIDLRSHNEVENDGRGLIADAPFDFHHVPLFDESRAREEAPRDFVADMAQLYYFILRGAGDRVIRVIRILGESDNPCVFHCSAGKDRTGVISALILSLVGVPRETIIADYAFSRQNLDQINARLRSSRSYQDIMDDLPDGAFEADPETMEGFLDRVDRKFGSVPGWAESAGLDAREVTRLQERLLEDG